MASLGTSFGSFGTLHLRWGWMLALGILLIILGLIALGDTIAVTFVSVFLLGWLLIASAIVHAVHLIRHTEVRSFWSIINVILDLVIGFLLIANPGLGALSLTLVLAAFFFVTGVMRLINAISSNIPHKFWPILNGVVSILLGVLLWIHWPISGLWFIGLAIGIELLLRGWTLVMLAFAVRSHHLHGAMLHQPA
jgi:uncharacterized membrane protein HdeD (DUF308 family)